MIEIKVKLTKEEFKELKNWTPLSDAMFGDALVNGMVNQILEKKEK